MPREPFHELDDMFFEAERDKLWFYCSYQNLWFSPAQLREHQAQGSFRWGPINWELRPPKEYLDQLAAQRAHLKKTMQRVLAQIED